MGNYYHSGDGALNNFNVSGYVDFSPYNSKPIYNFDPIFNVDTGNLSAINTGVSVHQSKDVTFLLTLNDRQLNTLQTTNSIAENPFVQSVNIDILNVSGVIIYQNFVSNSYKNNFIFSEQDNINVFGKYTPNFGVGIHIIGYDTNIHSNEYYVYGNSLEINNISVTDGNGLWSNKDPLGYQSYQPSYNSGSGIDIQNVTNSALYFSKYNTQLSGYRINLTGSLAFARLAKECIYVDWGNSQLSKIFQQTGVSGFSGISGITQVNTDTGDFRLVDQISPTGINGKTYNFSTGYNYPTGVTGIYNVNFYYSGSGSTSNELIKSIQYRLPDELKPQGKPQIGSNVTGKIQFDINFQNNPYYVKPDQLKIYYSDSSGVPLNENNQTKTIPILTNTSNYSFYLNDEDLGANSYYWLSIIPFSKISQGFPWTIGPYSVYKQPATKQALNAESINLINGTSTASIDLITGSILTTGVTIIDSLAKGTKYTYEYLTQFQDQSGCFCSSKLLIVDNTSGLALSRTGLSF